MNREEFLEVYRHSLSHILAKAVIEIFGSENVQYAIGPQIADGFYYDFVLPRAIGPDDFKTIENKMREILKRKEEWKREEVTREEALKIFEGQKFKTELIEELPEGELITIYRTGDDFTDLCRGPHVDNSAELLGTAFEIRSASGAYWRGDEHRDSLQRVYCYAFPDKKQLKEHKDPGMAYWLPRGWKSYNALLDFWRGIHEVHGYNEISGPVLSKKELWVTSGHWGHYMDGMFIIPGETIDDDNTMALKPMNCPNAIKVYMNKPRSYKDLPLRINQVDVIHRKEKSGELNGLFRVQEFRQDDAHILVAEEQIADEIKDIMDIATQIYGTFGLTYAAELSTRPDNYMGDIEVWNKAEEDLKEILLDVYGEGGFEVNEGDGAFYGPKIDLKMKDALGREWQMGTIQLDFQLPLNFDMKYTAQDGTLKRPVMIHRAIFGSIERFIGILIENFKGAFPFWLSPVQVGVVPIREEHNAYAKEVMDLLRVNRVRAETDYSDKNMKVKIKTFKNYKDPYILVLGDKEAQERTVSINLRGSNKQIQNVPLDTFIEMCVKMNREYSLDMIESAENL